MFIVCLSSNLQQGQSGGGDTYFVKVVPFLCLRVFGFVGLRSTAWLLSTVIVILSNTIPTIVFVFLNTVIKMHITG